MSSMLSATLRLAIRKTIEKKEEHRKYYQDSESLKEKKVKAKRSRERTLPSWTSTYPNL